MARRLYPIAWSVLALTFAATPALAAPPAQFGHEGSGAGEFEEAAGIAIDQQDGAVYLRLSESP